MQQSFNLQKTLLAIIFVVFLLFLPFISAYSQEGPEVEHWYGSASGTVEICCGGECDSGDVTAEGYGTVSEGFGQGVVYSDLIGEFEFAGPFPMETGGLVSGSKTFSELSEDVLITANVSWHGRRTSETTAGGTWEGSALGCTEYGCCSARGGGTWQIYLRLPPVASFAYSPGKPLVGEKVIFDASASHDPDGTIERYKWDFGDGPIEAAGAIVEHSYSVAGKYRVRLIVVDNWGFESLPAEQEITVGGKLAITEAKTDKPIYTFGEREKVFCNVIDENGIAVSGAFVISEITKPDNSVETILLSGKQQGGYEGVFTNFSVEGTYNATIKAQKQDFPDATPVNLTFAAARNKIPLGKSISIFNSDVEFYSIYVPDHNGGNLTVTATGGGKIGLYYPDPYTKVADAATQINYPVAFNQHGWYYVKVLDRESISKISNTFIQTGEASYRPWNFWYWPLKKDRKVPEKNLYALNGTLNKYDIVFGTIAREYEEKNWGGDDWSSGAGHCTGGSIASILLPEPKEVLYGGQTFSQEEMEGLAIKLANTDFVIAKPILPKGIKFPAKKPEDVKWVDEFADEFYKALQRYLLQKRVPLQCDLRDPSGVVSSAVWNHAVYGYKANMEESGEGREDVVKIITKLYSNYANYSDSYPSSNNEPYREDTYIFKFKYKHNGQIDNKFSGQDWISTSGFLPEDIVIIIACWFDNAYYPNPHVTAENVKKLGIKFPWYVFLKNRR